MNNQSVEYREVKSEEIKEVRQMIKFLTGEEILKSLEEWRNAKKEKKMTSIIIPVRYSPSLTQVCIDSILLYTTDYELIVVQEGEDEKITKLLSNYVRYTEKYGKILGKGQVKFLQNKTPKGYAGALNDGMKIAQGDYFCFMNNDTVVTPNWLDEMLKAFEDKEVGLVSPTFWGTGDRQSVDWNTGEQFDSVIDPFALIGVCYLIPRAVMDKVGKFDEVSFKGKGLQHGGEDLDMTYRMSKAGYKMIIARRSFIYHYGGASTRELFNNEFKRVKENVDEKLRLLAKKHNLSLDEVYRIKK